MNIEQIWHHANFNTLRMRASKEIKAWRSIQSILCLLLTSLALSACQTTGSSEFSLSELAKPDGIEQGDVSYSIFYDQKDQNL